VADDGERRIDNPKDHVRLEIETALKRKIRVIPILVDDAWTPHASELPPTLAPLVRRNAVEDQAEAMADIIRGQMRSVAVNVALDRMSLELLPTLSTLKHEIRGQEWDTEAKRWVDSPWSHDQ
jgi:hypothetical protein